MSKASNYILEHCIEKLTKINSSNFVLGFLVESGSSPSFINLNSEVFINTSQLTEGQSNILKNDLITHLFNGECPRQPLFFTQENQFVYTQLFKNKNINNFRYIPFIEGDELYAVVVLINIAFSSVTHALANVEPFICSAQQSA